VIGQALSHNEILEKLGEGGVDSERLGKKKTSHSK